MVCVPRKRFNQLPAERRERLWESSARELSAKGFEGASLNRILEGAGFSKGAAYYYFDSKEDLFAAAARELLQAGVAGVEADGLEFANYWDALEQIFLRQFEGWAKKPWTAEMTRALRSLPAAHVHPSVGEVILEASGTLLKLLRRGKELGLIRQDLPDELLANLVQSVDDAHDRWLLGQSPEDPGAAAKRITCLLQRLLTAEPTKGRGHSSCRSLH
jgi:AcrR family transcriptional regulator